MPALAYAYTDVSVNLARGDCKDIGVYAWSDSWEYVVHRLVREAGGTARFRSVNVENPSARFAVKGPNPCSLLLLGRPPDEKPVWAADWEPVASHRVPLGGIALYRPRR
jgi:hypothetical protein